jgi:hypothetical protein
MTDMNFTIRIQNTASNIRIHVFDFFNPKGESTGKTHNQRDSGSDCLINQGVSFKKGRLTCMTLQVAHLMLVATSLIFILGIIFIPLQAYKCSATCITYIYLLGMRLIYFDDREMFKFACCSESLQMLTFHVLILCLQVRDQ